ncbi:hypothetical protein [Streptomyces sp. NPDC046805]|uniref:hypothetical protein n=1 Tax=Streptomyces sp. NPDC046805 TaxID=3155134 RepID=UPI0033C58E6E
MKVLAGVLAGLVLGGGLGFGLAASSQAPASVVSTFNDGFADSKQDDCERGFEDACTWVMVQNGIPTPPPNGGK